jgi:UDP-N-acetylglucosamine pyrophosphorylase
MNFTFIEALAYYKRFDDEKSKNFLEYIMLKYFNNNNIFMKISDATPFLDAGDLEMLIPIAESVE